MLVMRVGKMEDGIVEGQTRPKVCQHVLRRYQDVLLEDSPNKLLRKWKCITRSIWT